MLRVHGAGRHGTFALCSPKSGHGSAPVRLSFSSSSPSRILFPARYKASCLPPRPYRRVRALGGPSSGLAHRAASSVPAEGTALHLPRSPPLLHGGRGGRRHPCSSASVVGNVTGAPGVWARLRGPTASLGVSCRAPLPVPSLSCRCCGVLCRGPREAGEETAMPFFCGVEAF